MVKRFLAIGTFALVASLCSPGAAFAQQRKAAPAATPAIALPPNPAVTKRAVEWLHRLQVGDIDRSQLDATLNAKLSPQSIGLIQAELGPFGTPQSIQLVASRVQNGNDAYLYLLNFKAARLQEVMIVEPSGKLAGLVFSPAR